MASIDRSLLDEIFSHYDVSAKYEISVRATPDRIYQVLEAGIPTGGWTKVLMAIRGLPRYFRKEKCGDAMESFYRLKQLRNREMVIGIIGQFWKPVATTVPISSLDEFLHFQKDGFCKAALNLRIVERQNGDCLVLTETRVIGYGEAKDHFRKYWRLVGPFSGIIRREILRKIKALAEFHPQ
jgi:hypothetical protein